MEPEVPRLDHAGVDRSDGDLVRVGAAHGRGEPGEGNLVVDQRSERLVTGDAVAVRHSGRVQRAQPSPGRSPSTIAESGGHRAAPVRASSIVVATAVSAVTARSPGAVWRSRRRGLPTTVSMSAWTSPRNPRA